MLLYLVSVSVLCALGLVASEVARAMVVSMTQLGTYDQAKTVLTPILGDNTGTHLASALTAAVVYSFASLPLVSYFPEGQ